MAWIQTASSVNKVLLLAHGMRKNQIPADGAPAIAASPFSKHTSNCNRKVRLAAALLWEQKSTCGSLDLSHSI